MDIYARAILVAGIFCGVVACTSARGQGQAKESGVAPFTVAQAAQGRAAFENNCSACHGDNLDNGEFAPALKGPAFIQNWGTKTAGDLFGFMATQMPPNDPGGLNPSTYAAILAFIVSQNGGQPGAKELPADPTALKFMSLPGHING